MASRSRCVLAVAVLLWATACSNDSTSPSTSTSYTGPFTGQMIVTTTTGNVVCISTRTLNGTLTITLQQSTSGSSVTGTAQTSGSLVELSVTPSTCAALGPPISLVGTRPVSGTTTNMTFASSSTSTTQTGGGATVACTDTFAFAGALTTNIITGTLSYTNSCQGTSGVNTVVSNGAAAIPVALR